jgi:BASS family bile acid:Na+ symporter
MTVFIACYLLALIFVWGWVLGPALGYLISSVVPLAEPYKVVVLLASVAPCAPFLQQMVEKARGDTAFAGALIPLVAVGTVVLMPTLAPLLVKGVTISAWSLAKPLLLTILLPLLIGAAIRHYADTAATRMFPAVKGLAFITTLLTTVWCLAIFGRGILDTAGELALLSMTVYMVGMGLIIYNFSVGLKQNQRSIMAWAMSVLWIVWSIPLAAMASKIFARSAGKDSAGSLDR